jgi:hyperosmotically inducible protein
MMLCGLAATVQAQNRSREPRVESDGPARAESARRSQAYLVKEVRHELLTLPYYGVFDWITYEAQPDGTVTLRGQVVRPTTKTGAGDVVKGIEGVTQVRNEIEVLPLSPNDDRLREALYRVIYSGPLFRYAVGSLNTIHLIVRNGRATLEGWVSSEADKQIAYTRASGVPGLFSVTNELRVENMEPR